MVNCSKCSKEIKTKDDLVVAPYFLIPRPYHRECYSKILTHGIYPPFFSTPINVPITLPRMMISLLGIGIFGAIVIVWFFLMSGKGLLGHPIILATLVLILFAFVLGIAQRVYSYFVFEKKLK